MIDAPKPLFQAIATKGDIIEVKGRVMHCIVSNPRPSTKIAYFSQSDVLPNLFPIWAIQIVTRSIVVDYLSFVFLVTYLSNKKLDGFLIAVVPFLVGKLSIPGIFRLIVNVVIVAVGPIAIACFISAFVAAVIPRSLSSSARRVIPQPHVLKLRLQRELVLLEIDLLRWDLVGRYHSSGNDVRRILGVRIVGWMLHVLLCMIRHTVLRVFLLRGRGRLFLFVDGSRRHVIVMFVDHDSRVGINIDRFNVDNHIGIVVTLLHVADAILDYRTQIEH